MKILITGASGFSGRHLVELLGRDSKNDLYFVDRSRTSLKNSYTCDLSDAAGVKKIIEEVKPQKIYNLAGTFTNDYETDYRSNVLAVKNLLDSVVPHPEMRVLLVGSAAEYGPVREEDNPVAENFSLNPVTVYGLTKVFQTHLMDYYRKAHNLNVVMARTFNLLGSGMSDKLLIGRLERQIDRYKNGELDFITVGNVENFRDYIEIGEAVKKYRTIMDYGTAGEIYNVGSGTPVKISDLVESVLKKAGLEKNVIKRDESRKQDGVSKIYADIGKLKTLESIESQARKGL